MVKNIFNELYEQLLLEAIWDSTDSVDPNQHPFAYNLITMYEMEYKLYRLQQATFPQNPKRLENMINGVEQQLLKSTMYVKNILLQTFDNWLQSHAILNPHTWATARFKTTLQDADDDYSEIEALLSEYDRYATIPRKQPYGAYYNNETLNPRYEQLFQNIISQMTTNIDQFPAYKKILEDLVLRDYKEWELQNYEDSPEDVKERYRVTTDEEVIDAINKLTIHDIEPEISPYLQSYKEFEQLPGWYFKDILIEIYEKILFPFWYGHWKARGIDKTRANVENVYNHLKNSNNLKDMIVWTNAALNTAHQNGSMLEYVENLTGETEIDYLDKVFDLSELFDKLTNDGNQSEWDKELREVGIKA